MAGSNGSLQQNPAMNSLFASLDPRSLILSQFSSFHHQPQTLQLTTDSFFMERGPRYDDYAALRDSKLRMKQQEILFTEENEDEFKKLTTVSPPPPQKKQVKFQGNLATPPKRTKGSSILTQSVPDFSSALRKENRKPTTTAAAAEKSMLPPLAEKSLTPPLKSKSGRFEAIMGKLGGSKSVNSGEKRGGGGFMARKSYASLDELRSFTSDARIAINGENRVAGRTTAISTRGGVGKTVLGYRQY